MASPIDIGRGRIAAPRQPQTLPDTGEAALAASQAEAARRVAGSFNRLAAAAGQAQLRVEAEAKQEAEKQERLKTNNQTREFAALGQGFEKVSILKPRPRWSPRPLRSSGRRRARSGHRAWGYLPAFS